MSSCHWPSAAWTAPLWVWQAGIGPWPQGRTSAASPPTLFPWSLWLLWSARSCQRSIRPRTPFCSSPCRCRCLTIWGVRLLNALPTRWGPGLHTAPADRGRTTMMRMWGLVVTWFEYSIREFQGISWRDLQQSFQLEALLVQHPYVPTESQPQWGMTQTQLLGTANTHIYLR